MSDQLTFWSEERPVNPLAWQDFGKALMTLAGILCSHMELLRIISNLPGLSGKTSPAYCHPTGGGDFATFLGMLAELGYGFAYRILDAQYFGVAQRRRRVFVVGYLGDWRPAASVLFEPESMCGHPAPSRKTREEITRTISSRTTGGGGLGTDFELAGGLQTVGTLCASGAGMSRPAGQGNELDFIIPAIMAHGQSNAEIRADGGAPALTCNHEAPIVAYAPFAFPANLSSTQYAATEDLCPAMGAKNPTAVIMKSAVRRLTPKECERLQGFPDDWTRIPWRGKPLEQCPDGPRYKACGNSMAVPVMKWIGRRISICQ